MILEYALTFNIKDEPTYWLREILFEHDAFNVEDSEIPIFEPSDAYEEALAQLKNSIISALTADLVVNPSDIRIEFDTNDIVNESVVMTVHLAQLPKRSPIAITHRNLTRLQRYAVIGNGREALKNTIREDLSSILSDDEAGELFEELESDVKDSFKIDGIEVESVDVIEP